MLHRKHAHAEAFGNFCHLTPDAAIPSYSDSLPHQFLRHEHGMAFLAWGPRSFLLPRKHCRKFMEPGQHHHTYILGRTHRVYSTRGAKEN